MSHFDFDVSRFEANTVTGLPTQRTRVPSCVRNLYLSEIAGNRFNVRLAGSIVMPTDSNAVTPRIGSASSGPKITRPAVTSPMKNISTNPNEYSSTFPLANSYAVLPAGSNPILRSSEAGARESAAPVSTRKSASYFPFCDLMLFNATCYVSQSHKLHLPPSLSAGWFCRQVSGFLSRQLSQKPPHRIVEVVYHPLLQWNDRVVGDVDIFGANFGAALGYVAEADSEFLVQ